MDLGQWGVFSFTDMLTPVQLTELAQRTEHLGYAALWYPEVLGYESFALGSFLLTQTTRLVIASGIANMYARDATAAKQGQHTLAKLSGGRFLLGLGVSHVPLVEEARGHQYRPPVATMRAYLEAMDSALYLAAPPPVEPVRVLAALGPRMLALAAEKAAGAHPYFVPPEHTARAREVLGPDRLLAPEQAVVLETDPARARELARKHMSIYIGLPNYANNLRRLGWSDGDMSADGGSDRLVDAIVAWGDVDAIVRRVGEHLQAGADHVCVQFRAEKSADPAIGAYRELASAFRLQPTREEPVATAPR